MGRPRRQSGDRSQSPYRLKSDPADVKLENVGFLRIRRWYEMQTSRLRRSDAIQSRPIPKNHDGAPAATATSPLSKRKVFGG
uniref:Uncharacterized protein n=1 Tax=Daphnia galeata TaxID=27404 RepID=A0A8J2WBQ9_9CRUS|nr:unnamed protein product [Daphnia galeata]